MHVRCRVVLCSLGGHAAMLRDRSPNGHLPSRHQAREHSGVVSRNGQGEPSREFVLHPHGPCVVGGWDARARVCVPLRVHLCLCASLVPAGRLWGRTQVQKSSWTPGGPLQSRLAAEYGGHCHVHVPRVLHWCVLQDMWWWWWVVVSPCQRAHAPHIRCPVFELRVAPGPFHRMWHVFVFACMSLQVTGSVGIVRTCGHWA